MVNWAYLTPGQSDHGAKCLVNLAKATSIWEHASGGSEIYFGAGHEDAKFVVRETLDEILGAPEAATSK